jgi:nicotinamide mononucleotide adenylyltransferase
MLADENWKVLVPKVVVDIITKIDGVQRLNELAMTDSPFRRTKVFH